MFIHITLQTILSFLLSYASFVFVYISFIKRQDFHLLNLFYFLTLVAFTGASIYKLFFSLKKSFQKNNKIKSFIKDKKFFFLLALCLLSLIINFFNVKTQYDKGMFFDEATQLTFSFNKDPIKISYKQQQPPLDYYFSAFSGNLFGFNKFAVRFHATFFYLLLSFIISLIFYFFTSSLWISFIGSSLFLSNHLIKFFSIYGRPLSLSLLTGFLFLFFYLSYSMKDKLKYKTSFLSLCASQYLFIMSVGLQPVIFTISLFCSSFLFLFKNKKNIFRNLFFSNILTAFLTLPFYIQMYRDGVNGYKFKAFSIDIVKSYIEKFDAFYFIETYFFNFYTGFSFLFLFTLIGLFYLILFKKRSLNSNLLIVFGSLVFFPVIYDFTFHAIISWTLNSWYIITFSLSLILFIVLALKEFNHFLKHKSYKNYVIYLIFSFFIFSSLFQIVDTKNQAKFNFLHHNGDIIKKIYKYIQKIGQRQDMALTISLTPLLDFRKDHLSYFEKFYNKKEISIVVNYLHDKLFYYINNSYFKKNQKIFFLINIKYNNDYTFKMSLDLFGNYLKEGDFILFQLVLPETEKEKYYIDFLYKFKKRTLKKYRGSLLETLMYYAHKNNKKKEFDDLFQEYKGIDFSYVTESYPSRFKDQKLEFEKRLNLLKKLRPNK